MTTLHTHAAALLATTAEAAAASPDQGLFTLAGLIALLTLAALEIVLGIDNVIFIAIVTQKLPPDQRAKARSMGLLLAAVMRVLLLLAISWVLRLQTPLFDLPFLRTHAPGPDGTDLASPISISGKDLVLLLGGLFLIAKSTWEIRHQITHQAGHTGHADQPKGSKALGLAASFSRVILQILLLDLVFSLDSVITAAGMTKHIPIMIAAVLISVGVMLAFSGPVSRFVERNPSVKILALAFLVLIGVLLLAEGLHQHFERGYVYFAMAFALGVDLLQMKQSPRPTPDSPTPAGKV